MHDSDPSFRRQLLETAEQDRRPEHQAQDEYYELLGVNPGADAKGIEAAYQAKLKGLNVKKSAAQEGRGALVAENEFQRLKEARDSLLAEAEEQVANTVTQENYPEITRFTVHVKETAEEKFDRQAEKAWAAIGPDNHLRAIISYCMLPEVRKENFLEERDRVTEVTVREFYRQYPTLGDLIAKSNPAGIVDRVGAHDPAVAELKKNQYKQAVNQFAKIMYPETRVK